MGELRIRPFRKGDADEIIKWCSDEWTFYKWTAGKMGKYPLTAEKLLEVTSGRVDNDKYFPFCAFDDSGVVGFFTLRQPGVDPTELSFGFVIISPEIRGKGYGKKMLELGIMFAKELYGAKKLGLGVFDNNDAARYCYKSVGFVENGITECYDICGQKWNFFEMELK